MSREAGFYPPLEFYNKGENHVQESQETAMVKVAGEEHAPLPL